MCAATDYIVEEPEETDDTLPTTGSLPFDPDMPTISLNVIAGIRTEDTMQVYITVGNDQFVALLDSGSTHNFIHSDVGHRVRLQF